MFKEFLFLKLRVSFPATFIFEAVRSTKLWFYGCWVSGGCCTMRKSPLSVTTCRSLERREWTLRRTRRHTFISSMLGVHLVPRPEVLYDFRLRVSGVWEWQVCAGVASRLLSGPVSPRGQPGVLLQDVQPPNAMQGCEYERLRGGETHFTGKLNWVVFQTNILVKYFLYCSIQEWKLV